MIPLVKTYLAPKEELMPALERVLYSGYIALGEEVSLFEKQLGEYLSASNVVALNSGTAALHIALLLLHVGPGDEVISTPMTAEPTNTVIANTGAKVVWADVNPDTGLLDPTAVRDKITEKTKAIMLVHYAGMVCDLEAFQQISKETGVPVIEDAAHALGARYDGKMIGTISPYTCFSFQAIKHMTTVDGGALSLQLDIDAHEAKKLRWFGLDKEVSRLSNDITRAGYKYGMNNVTAVMGQVQLAHLQAIIARHVENGHWFDEQLKDTPGVSLIPYAPRTEPSYWLYTMKVESRDDFCKMMQSKGITASPLHHRSDTHSVFAASKCDLPALDAFYKSFVHIPCGWWVGQEERQLIVNAIRSGW